MTETYHGFIDTAHDALLIFEACNSGFLPRVQRRFSDRERQTIRSGAVYVWDEEETGMRRWTDGRTWSPSRVHGCFLIYYELEGRRHQFVNKNNATSGRSSRNSPRSGQIEPSPFHTTYDSSPPNIMQKEQGLIKKALSLCTNDKRKLHLVCYYSREDVENGALMSPTNDSRFSGVQIFEDRYPEIGHGSGRSDRFAGGRSKNALASRQWNPTTPDSPGNTRDGPPAYVRTSMIIEKRSRSYRNEVFRYPSYGPYPGPVRHVNAPAPQPQHMYQQQPLLQQFGDDGSSTIDSISNTQPAVHSSMLPRPMPREFIDSASHIDPSQRHVPTRDQAGQRNQSQQYPYATQYDERTHTQDIRHGSTLRTPGEQSSLSTVSHSFPVEAWKSAPISSGSTFSKQEYDYRRQQQSTHVHSSHTSSHTAIPSGFMPTSSSGPSNSLSGVTASAHPVWQHNETPRAYANSSEQQRYHNSHWDGGSSGRGSNSLPINSGGHGNSSLTYGGAGAHTGTSHSAQHMAPSMVKLPSIERFDSAVTSDRLQTQERWKKHTPPPQPPTAVAADGGSRMNSEDMRQLASLRFSLH